MSPNEKVAWTNLVIVGVAVVAFLVAVPVLASCFHKSWIEAAQPAFGVFGVVGFAGFCGLFYRPLRRPRPLVDERDRQIQQRSGFIGFGVFWVVWVLGSVGAWGTLRHLGVESISIEVLPTTVFVGMIVFLVAQSVAILVQYGRSSHDGA